MEFRTESADCIAPNRRERRKLEIRERILTAAMELFAGKGVASTTVAEISERADVATKTFFNHFSTKQQLIETLAHATFETFLFDLQKLRHESSGIRDWLIRFFDQITENVTAAGPMHREFLTEIVHAINGDATHHAQAHQLREAFLSVVRDGTTRGEVETTHDPETQTELIIGAFYSLMFNWTHLESYPMRERSRAMAELLGDTLSRRTKEDA